jgi:Tfp pilus assembly ATPase PilU
LPSAGSVTQHDKIPDNFEKLDHMASPRKLALLKRGIVIEVAGEGQRQQAGKNEGSE